MSPSAGFQLSLNSLQTRNVLWKLTGHCCILLFLLCCFACQESKGKKADVTFDRITAYPALVLSSDKKTARNAGVLQMVPDNPERFNSSPCALGSPGFRTGKHSWEVEYGTQREWAVGVARKSVERKVYLRLVPEEGIWQVGFWWLRQGDAYKPSNRKGKVTISVDYDKEIAVFKMDGKITKVTTNFSGEEAVPFFYIGAEVSLKIL